MEQEKNLQKFMDKFIPYERAEVSYVIKKSKFLVTASPVFTAEEARLFISEIKKKYSDATHNVSAFIIGSGNSVISGCSDDGEPAGTAGKPILTALTGSIFTNIVLVSTRWFGGIKLGTGGLVKAYSEGVFQIVPLLKKSIILCVDKVDIIFDYSCYENIMFFVGKFGAEVESSDFSENVKLTCIVKSEKLSAFKKELIDLTSGKILFEILEQNSFET